MLRDQLICGINDAEIQRCLLTKEKVDFQTALGIAQAMETADKDAHHLQDGWGETAHPTAEAAVQVLKPN